MFNPNRKPGLLADLACLLAFNAVVLIFAPLCAEISLDSLNLLMILLTIDGEISKFLTTVL